MPEQVSIELPSYPFNEKPPSYNEVDMQDFILFPQKKCLIITMILTFFFLFPVIVFIIYVAKK